MKENISFILGGGENVSFVEFSISDAINAGNGYENFIEKYNVYGYTHRHKIPIEVENKNKKDVTKDFFIYTCYMRY